MTNEYSEKVRTKFESLDTYVRGLFSQVQPTPATKAAAATITIADMLKKIVILTQSPATGATVALTVDTGINITAGLPRDFKIGDSFEFTILNASTAAADTGTLTAAAGVTLYGAVIIPSSHSTTIVNSSKTYRVVKTGKTAYEIYAV